MMDMGKRKKIRIMKIVIDYIKANRKGSREAEIENSTGFIGSHKIHTSKKTYTRKEKHKK